MQTASKISLRFIGRLFEAIYARGESEPHTKVVRVIGTPFTFERMWFSGSLNTERMKLYGRDWHILIEYTKGFATGVMAYSGVYMDLPGKDNKMGRYHIICYEIANEPAILRDLSTLRLAGGFDHLFEGNGLRA